MDDKTHMDLFEKETLKMENIIQNVEGCLEHLKRRYLSREIKMIIFKDFFFSSPEHEVLMVSYCDRAVSVVRCAVCVVGRQIFILCML